MGSPCCSTSRAASALRRSSPPPPSSSSSRSTAASCRPTGPTARSPPTCWSRWASGSSPSLVLVAAGFGPSGAAIGVLIGEVVAAAHARWASVRAWSDGRLPRLLDAGSWVAAVRPDRVLGGGQRSVRRTVVLDLVVASVSLSMVAVLQNVDVLVVGRDNPGHSGAYAAVSVTSKAIVFGAIVLGGYLLPEAAIRWRQGGHALRQLAVVLVLLAVPSVLLLAVAVVAPEQLLQLVFHHAYTSAADALAPLVLAMILLSISVVLTMYLLAVGQRWVALRPRRRAPSCSPGPCWPCTGPHGPPPWWTWRCRRWSSGWSWPASPSSTGSEYRGRSPEYPDPMGDDLGPVPAAPGAGRRLRASESESEPEVLAAIAAAAGIRRIHFVAWRDLDDPEAGGSELHAHKIASRWAAAGLDVTFRTSAVPDAPAALTRDGYRVLRRSGRYAVFPGAAWEGMRMGHRPGDALVEIWNGMPFLSPALVPRAPHRPPAPRPCRDVGHGPPADAGPDGERGRTADRPALLPLEPHRHALRFVPPTRSSTAPPAGRPRHRGPTRGGRALRAGRPAPAPHRSSSPSGGWCPSSASTCSCGRWPPLKSRLPGAAGGHHRGGLRADGARGAARRARARPTGSACPAAWTTPNWWPGTAGPGSWPAARSARGGA